MEKTKKERVLAYKVSTPLDQCALEQVTGGANPNPKPSSRVVLTGDYIIPDVVVEL